MLHINTNIVKRVYNLKYPFSILIYNTIRIYSCDVKVEFLAAITIIIIFIIIVIYLS